MSSDIVFSINYIILIMKFIESVILLIDNTFRKDPYTQTKNYTFGFETL